MNPHSTPRSHRTPPAARRLAGAVLLLALLPLAGCNQLFPYRSPGEKLWRKHCTECHGLDAAGNTARYMGNAYADLRDSEWKNCGPDSSSLRAVTETGVFGGMPGFSSKLSKEEIALVVDYLRELRGEKVPAPRPR